MQQPNNSAQQPKDSEKPLNWRHRKAAVARRKQLEDEAAARKPAMIQAYVAALGGADRVGPLVMLDIERCVDLSLIAAETRLAVRLGTARLEDMARIEVAADKARRRLNLPPAGAAAAPTGLHDIVARHSAGREEAD